jgi:MGT family glycosyltransferase
VAKFLITVWPFPGHTHVNMAIAQALKSHGHRVAVYTGSAALPMFEREELECHEFRRLDERFLEEQLMDERAATSSLRGARARLAALRSWLVETLPAQVEDLEQLIDDSRPDAVVSDVTMWGVPLVLAEKLNLRVAISLFTPGAMIPGPEAPPWGLGLPRPRGPAGRLLARSVQGLIDLFAGGFRSGIDAVRERHFLAPLDVDVHTFLGRMPLYLVPSTPEFDYQRSDLPASVRYIGGLSWNKHDDEPPPHWLGSLPENEPVVHVTEGTMHAGRPLLLSAAARGLAGLPMQVVMTTGRERDPSSLGLGSLAPNIRVERWVPHADLLPRTDVMVTTGGGSTVVAGVRAGVPMVVVPTQWDKPDNAQRVREAGVGLRLSPGRCTPGRLREYVSRILNDGTYRDNARKLAREFARLGRPERTARLLEDLALAPVPTGPAGASGRQSNAAQVPQGELVEYRGSRERRISMEER